MGFALGRGGIVWRENEERDIPYTVFGLEEFIGKGCGEKYPSGGDGPKRKGSCRIQAV